MQEPQRFNLFGVLQKSLKVAQKKIYLHRIIYIVSYTQDRSEASQDSRLFNLLIDSNIRLINEEYCEDIITGFGLFYEGYFINIVEGPEETLIKHLKTLMDTFDQNEKKTSEINRMKVLLVLHHINRRYYSSWNGRQATPPLLLDKIDPTVLPEINYRHIQNCIMKLYRMSEYLRNQAPNLLRAAMDNISDLCRAFLPEVNLLDFLLDSPALLDLKEYIRIYGSVPSYTRYHETIWPLPPDFVPYKVFGEDASKSLMLMDLPPQKTKEIKEEEEAND